MSAPSDSSGRRIARAAALVMPLFAASRALGLVREMVISAAFGTSAEYDAYVAAVTVPDILFALIAGGALGSAFIPTFAAYFAQDDAEGGWRLASAVVNLVLLTLTAAALLSWLGAPVLVREILVPGFGPERQALTTSLMRVMLIAPIFFGISGVVMGILNARQHFLLPALAPSLLNLSLIAAAWLLAPRMGVRALAVGYAVGAVLHLGIQLPGLIQVGAHYRPLITLRHPGVRQVLRLMAPRVLGLAAVQINFLVNKNVASWLERGALSALNYAWRMMLLPQGVFALAVATVAFPTFAEQVAREERGPMQRTLTTTLRLVFFITIPAAVGLLMLKEPLVALLFERGAFQESSTEAVALALAFYALGLVGHAGVEIMARAFYALHDTWTPVWVGVLTMGLNIVLSLTLPSVFVRAGLPPYGGLALANSVATLLEMGGLMALIRVRLGGLDGRALFMSALRSGLAATGMAAALVVWRRVSPSASSLVVGGVGILLGAGIYLVAAALLQARELRDLTRLAPGRGQG